MVTDGKGKEYKEINTKNEPKMNNVKPVAVWFLYVITVLLGDVGARNFYNFPVTNFFQIFSMKTSKPPKEEATIKETDSGITN
jgi:hypothetical protein